MSHRLVRSIIEHQNLLTAPPEMTVSEAAGLMKRNQIGAIIVAERGRLAGISERVGSRGETCRFEIDRLRLEKLSVARKAKIG